MALLLQGRFALAHTLVDVFKISSSGGTLLAQSFEHVTLDLEIVSLSPTLGGRLYLKQ